MINYQSIYDTIRHELGRKSQDLSSVFLIQMQAAQQRLEKRPTRPNWMKETATLTAAAEAVEVFGIPADFLAPYKERSLYYLDEQSKEVKLHRMMCEADIIHAREYRQDAVRFYYVHDRSIIMLSKKFDTDQDLNFQYYASEPALTGDNDNLWTTREGELIGWEAAMHIARGLRDNEKAQEFSELARSARNSLFVELEANSQEDVNINGD